MTIKQITNIIDQTTTLKLISQSYADIASAKINQIRQIVEKNGLYLKQLSEVYQVAKQTASQTGIIPLKPKAAVAIVITSNFYFYGNINQQLINFFLEQTKSDHINRIVIGQTGSYYLKELKYAGLYQEIFFKHDFPTSLELNFVIEAVKDYTSVLVFYPELQSIMVQKPTMLDITQTTQINLPKQAENLVIFEPEIDKILAFFETQVKNLNLQQTFLEAEVSRAAARLISMDQAQQKAQQLINTQKINLNLYRKTIFNNNLLQTSAALKKGAIW